MNDITALKIARKVLKAAAKHHEMGVKYFINDKHFYHTYMEAYNTLTAMQMGLDGETDEKELGWRESQA